MVPIEEINDPLERYFAFIEERNNIYHRKNKGDPWPWTEDPILQQYRFTEIYRERDRTSLHYQKTVRDRYGDNPIVLPATVLYRWFNRIDTCNAIFNDAAYGLTSFGLNNCFDYYMRDHNIGIIRHCIEKIPPPHVTGAFIITGKPGYSKGLGVIEYFRMWMEKPWAEIWQKWQAHRTTLEEMNASLSSQGLGSFLTAQLIADLKYVPSLAAAPDWSTWAAIGPGSSRGLNVILDRPMSKSWNKKEWLEEIQKLREKENKYFEGHPTITPFHAQDTQNHCCEFSKYEKVRAGVGRPRQVYRHV